MRTGCGGKSTENNSQSSISWTFWHLSIFLNLETSFMQEVGKGFTYSWHNMLLKPEISSTFGLKSISIVRIFEWENKYSRNPIEWGQWAGKWGILILSGKVFWDKFCFPLSLQRHLCFPNFFMTMTLMTTLFSTILWGCSYLFVIWYWRMERILFAAQAPTFAPRI